MTKPKQPSDPVPNIVREYKDIRKDYAFDGSIFNAEPERVAIVKQIIAEELNEVDRTLIILYADCLSYRKLGARLNLSHSTVAAEIKRIKADILRRYEEHTKKK